MKEANLLPKTRQTEIRYEDRFRKMLVFAGASSASFAVIIAALIFSRFYLENKISQLENETEVLRSTVNKQENAELKAQITKINAQILDYKTLSDTTPRLADVFKEFSELVPEGVNIGNFSLDVDKKNVEIRGLARDRAGMLTLYDNLSQDTENFTSVDYPLDNLALPANVTFHFGFRVQPKLIEHK